jgi:hypothetical protein
MAAWVSPNEQDTSPTERLASALSGATDPASVAGFWNNMSDSPAATYIEEWVKQRGMSLEELLMSYIGSVPNTSGYLLPLHRLSAIVLDACSVIVELQAALFFP